MLEQLLKLVREHATQHIVNNPAVPNQHNDAAINATSSAIEQGLRGAFDGGQLKDLLSLLGGRTQANTQNPIVGQIAGMLSQNLTGKCGVRSSSAQSIASQLIPVVLGSLSQRTNNPADSSFDMNGIFNHLSGGKAGGVDFGSLLSKMDRDGDGDVDLTDVMGQLGGAQQAAGLVGKLAGNLFGR